MSSYPTTGYWPETPERTRLRNEIKACIQLHREARGNGDDLSVPYWRNRSLNALRKYAEFIGRADPVQLRIAALQAEMTENPDAERASAIIDELAEYGNLLQRDGDAISDYGDALRERKFGEQL